MSAIPTGQQNQGGIKMMFKVWCKNKKEWEKDRTYLDSQGQLFTRLNSGIICHLSHENHKIVRYAKQMDDFNKNMKEFDILHSKWQEGHPLDGVHNCACVGIVLFDGNKFYILDLDDNSKYDLDDYGGDGDLKIIGNLVENEDFLAKNFNEYIGRWNLKECEQYLEKKQYTKEDYFCGL